MNRIATAGTVSTSGANCWGEQYGYDAWGNLQSMAGITPQYNGCLQESGFSITVNANNQIAGFCYDAAGNLLAQSAPPCPSPTYTYNAENQLTSTAGITYTYDGDGKRVEKSNGKLYWYGTSGDPLDETDLTGNTGNSSFYEYIFFGGKRIARRDSSGNVDYYFADHLGTARVVTNATGTVPPLDDSDFYPFGGQRALLSSSGNTYKFTGKERDAESGLDNFGARYMSSQYGRFMTPDPTRLSAFFDDPQTWNMYIYAHNNPLAYVDRNGKWPTPIHNQIYTAALSQSLTPDQMRLVQSVSAGQDSILGGGQFNNVAFEHAMRGPDQSIMQAEAQYDSFVSGQVQAAQEAQIKFWMANPGSHNLSNDALVHFAMALHAVTDSTSPAHAGFQLWDWRDPFLIWRHMQNEKSITPGQLQTAVSATQGLFNQTFGMFGFDEFDLLELQQQQGQQHQQQEQVTSRMCAGLDENGNCTQ